MAISANTVWEVRAAGLDTNGGGFVTGAAGTDYSQQDAKNTIGSDISTTDAVANGTTTITSATANFGTTIVGNIIYFQGGTGGITNVWRQVTARASTTSITIDATIAASTGMTMNIGGALASIGMVGFSLVSGNIIYIKGNTTITSATVNISGGCIQKVTTDMSIFGYQNTRLDWGTPPIITASGITNFTMITGGLINSNSIIANIQLDGGDLGTSRGINYAGLIYRVICEDFSSGAFTTTGSPVIDCIARSCTGTAPFNGSGDHLGCIAHSNTVTAFSFAGATQVIMNCIAYSNTGASTDGFSTTAVGATFKNCVAYGNGRDGFRTTGATTTIINCIAVANSAAIGFNASGSPAGMLWLNNAAFGNATDFSLGTGKNSMNLNSVILTGSPFVNVVTGDFALNTTSGAGESCRSAGHLGTFITGVSIGYEDIGAVQAQGSAGSGAGSLVLRGGSTVIPYKSNYY
jgi:hypothetical protein